MTGPKRGIMLPDDSDLFARLGPDDITVHTYLALQKRYPNLSTEELTAYKNRVTLRLTLLCDFARKNDLPINLGFIRESIWDIDDTLLEEMFLHLDIKETYRSHKNKHRGRVILFNGGPATGKSKIIHAMRLPKGALFLDRDALFPFLTPYERLQKEHPEKATHAVVCEAILYNERDAYRYALQCQPDVIVVDGTMSYLDLGLEMIKLAQEQGYRVEVINVDIDIDVATRRAEKRALEDHKTIDKKLLYESHVRCAAHFFHYLHVADHTENWVTDVENGKPRRYGMSDKHLRENIPKHFDGHVELLPSDQDHMVVYTITDRRAYNDLKTKAALPLPDVQWPASFDEFLHAFL